MDLHSKLLHLFPNYTEGDWELQDNGAGAYISIWNRPEPRPNAATLNAVTPQQQANARKAQRKKGILSDIKIKAMVHWIADLHGIPRPLAETQYLDFLDSL